MTRRITILIPLLAVLSTAACETVKGVGRDVQGAGAVVTQGAAEVQSEL
ncbi:MAG: entericidin EcnAB [Pseudorhodobacter sp.]